MPHLVQDATAVPVALSQQPSSLSTVQIPPIADRSRSFVDSTLSPILRQTADPNTVCDPISVGNDIPHWLSIAAGAQMLCSAKLLRVTYPELDLRRMHPAVLDRLAVPKMGISRATECAHALCNAVSNAASWSHSNGALNLHDNASLVLSLADRELSNCLRLVRESISVMDESDQRHVLRWKWLVPASTGSSRGVNPQSLVEALIEVYNAVAFSLPRTY